MEKATSCVIFCFLMIAFAPIEANSKNDERTVSLETTTSAAKNFIPYRYNRLIFFFFSSDVTLTFFKTILNKLIDFDNYCGGENYRTWFIFGTIENTDHKACELCSIEEYFSEAIESGVENSYLTFSKSTNCSAGSIDHNDVRATRTLLKKIYHYLSSPLPTIVNSQVILFIDYATDSLKSNNTTGALAALKLLYNITLVALTTNLTGIQTHEYFPPDIWTVFGNYINWSPENQTINPICNYNSTHFTTPSPSFTNGSRLKIYLFTASNLNNRTQLMDIVDLLSNLTLRRWLYPCRQYRHIEFELNRDNGNDDDCFLPGFPQSCYVEDQTLQLSKSRCSTSWFSDSLDISGKNYSASPQKKLHSVKCNSYDDFFNSFLAEKSLEMSKYLVITDLPVSVQDFTINAVYTKLKSYKEYLSGAPLTVIAVDKENNKSVAASFISLFPETQRANLYEVNDIAELLKNINRSVNYCLASWPWLDQRIVPYHRAIWYFFIIGAAVFAVLAALVVAFLILMKMRSRKRREKLKQISDRLQLATTTEASRNYYEYALQPIATPKDDWEVLLQSLDIDYKTSIGKGAFSIVHSGFLHGRAPVLNMFPSIALQQFTDCEVAIKTLPQHSTERDKTKFRNEIGLMKDVGYHVHLVSMLGCNCSIERPILLMELAEQDLLHWLHSARTTIKAEMNLGKTLLSMSWQISDGMSYLSSKKFIHRDLAARNVLLNPELKAMVSDFGLCRKLKGDEEFLKISGGRLPLKWMALESLQEEQFSLETDV